MSNILRKPYEEVYHFVPAAATPAAADGLLTVTASIVFKMNEIDKIEDAVATVAGTAQARAITLTGGVTAGAEYVVSITSRNRNSLGVHPVTARIRVPLTGTISLTTVAAQLAAAINKVMGFTMAVSAGALLTLTENELGPSFKANLWTDDPLATATGNIAQTVAPVYPVGLQADVQALLPHIPAANITGNCAKVVVWTKRFRPDGSVEPQKNTLFCIQLADAQAVKAAAVIGDTSATDESTAAQMIDVS
jgi:hypothetical protein